MAKKKDFSADLHLRIVTAQKEGKGYKAFSKQFIVPVATVQSIIKKYKTFNTLNNLGGRGRKSKVSTCMARKVWREPSKNQRITIKALQNSLSESGTTISRKTLLRMLHKGGFRGCRRRKTPLLKQACTSPPHLCKITLIERSKFLVVSFMVR